MPKQTNQSPFFNFVVDEERAELMQIMFSIMAQEWEGFAKVHPDRAVKLNPHIKDMVGEFSEKIHELGWCKAPDCADHE